MTRSEYFLVLCAAFIIGVGLGSFYDAELWVLLFFLGVAASLYFAYRKSNIGKISVIAVLILAGFIRIEYQKEFIRDAEQYAEFLPNQKIIIEGELIRAAKTKNNRQQLIIDNARNVSNGKNISGRLIAFVSTYPEFSSCSDIRIEGRIGIPENFEGFDYKMYLVSKGINYVIYYPDVLFAEIDDDKICKASAMIRTSVYELNKKIYTKPQSGIMNALILGIESDIGEDVINAFNKTGTRHLLAISGFNISIIGIIMMNLLLLMGIKRDNAFYFTSAGIIFYIFIIESSSSSIRAGIMGELALIAFKLGRLPSATNAIVFAAGIMLLENPYIFRYDIGYQLSFLAVLGLMFIYPKLEKISAKVRDIAGLKTIFIGTISAQIATFPILLYNFGNVSLMSVISNMLILPFAVPVMIGGFAMIFIGELNLFIARILSWPVWMMVHYQVEVIKFMAGIDLFSVEYKNMGSFFIIAYYAILLCVLKSDYLLPRNAGIFNGNKKILNP